MNKFYCPACFAIFGDRESKLLTHPHDPMDWTVVCPECGGDEYFEIDASTACEPLAELEAAAKDMTDPLRHRRAVDALVVFAESYLDSLEATCRT